MAPPLFVSPTPPCPVLPCLLGPAPASKPRPFPPGPACPAHKLRPHCMAPPLARPLFVSSAPHYLDQPWVRPRLELSSAPHCLDPPLPLRSRLFCKPHPHRPDPPLSVSPAPRAWPRPCPLGPAPRRLARPARAPPAERAPLAGVAGPQAGGRRASGRGEGAGGREGLAATLGAGGPVAGAEEQRVGERGRRAGEEAAQGVAAAGAGAGVGMGRRAAQAARHVLGAQPPAPRVPRARLGRRHAAVRFGPARPAWARGAGEGGRPGCSPPTGRPARPAPPDSCRSFD